MEYERVAVVFNERSGGGKTKKQYPAVFRKINANFKNQPFYFNSSSMEDTERFVIESLKEKRVDLIIAVGGDGTTSSICNAMMKVELAKRVPVLPLPLGSGNSLPKDMGINGVEIALQKVRDSKQETYFDALKIRDKDSEFYCVNLLGMGFISDIVELSLKSKKRFGAFTYIIAVFLGLNRFKPYRVTIRDGEKILFHSDRVFLLSINNNRLAGASFNMAPQANMTDGMADIIVLHDINRREFLAGFLKVFSGKHIHQKGCSYLKARSFTVESDPEAVLMPDGELFGISPVSVEVAQNQLKVPFVL